MYANCITNKNLQPMKGFFMIILQGLLKWLVMITVILIFMSCTAIRPPEPWPLLSGTTDIFKYYEGDDRSVEELSILQVDGPYCIEKEGRYYRKLFALLPGERVVDICYYSYNKFGAATRSHQPASVKFLAERGRTYRPFHLEYEDLASTAQHSSVWSPIILDVTDQAAIDRIINEIPYNSVKEQAIHFSTNKELLQHLANHGALHSIRRTAAERLKVLQFTDSFQP